MKSSPTLAETVEANRMVTVVGPGGVGKTRLALELGRTVAVGRDFVFVEFAPLLEDDAVNVAIADAVGAFGAESSGGPDLDPVSRSIDRLGPRDVLVVLDNCEHLTGAAAAVAAALCTAARTCGSWRRVGSRSASTASDRSCWRRSTWPRRASCSSIEPAPSSPTSTPMRRTRVELAELCRHLDGLPLAIELAAARTEDPSAPGDLLPSPGSVPAPAAHVRGRGSLITRVCERPSIGATSSCSPRSNGRSAASLSSPGASTIEAAEAVCGPDSFETATRLVDRSLLIADTSGDRVRLGMLESLRDYGWGQLVAAGELDDARTAHLAWCIALAERVDVEARRADQLEWLARLDREHDNLRAALAYGVDRDPAGALRLLGALLTPWWFRGRRPEMRHWTAVCLTAAPDVPSLDRARVLAYQGFIAEPAAHPVPGQVEDELEAAEGRQRAAVRIGEELSDPLTIASAQIRLMSTMTRRAAAGAPFDSEEFAALADQTYRAYDRQGDHYGAGCTMVSAAIGALVTGNLGAAARATEGARRHAEASGERFLTSRVAYLDGVLSDLDGDSQAAYRHVERSVRLLDELGHESVTAQAQLLAVLADRCKQPELAEQWRRFADAHFGSWSHFDGSAFATAHNHAGLRARAMRGTSIVPRHRTQRRWPGTVPPG